MRNITLTNLFFFLMILVTFSGCDLIYGVFEAGMWVGIIIVVLVIALILWIIRKIF